MANVTYSKTSMGRYEVLHQGERVGRIRTALRNSHWYWIVVGDDGSIANSPHYLSRDQAAAALVVG